MSILKTVSLAALFGLLVCSRGAEGETWRILALRVDFPLEESDESTTTGRGGFDLRSAEEALPDYFFPFELPPHDRTYFENHLESLSRYYRTVSEGQVEIEFAVYPRGPEEAYTLSQPMLHYGNGRSEEEIGQKWIELFREGVALAEADPDGPRFGDFDSFLIFHAGVGHETGELNDIRSVFMAERDIRAYADGPILTDGGSFEIRQGWILPESPSLRGQAGLNGLLAKFFGHQLGLPGLSNFADGLPGVGGWSLMDVGGNAVGFVMADSLVPGVGFVPPHPMAWSKARLGWIEPLVVVRDTTLTLLAGDRTGDLPRAVRVPLDGEEYLLLENRQQRGRRGLPEGIDSPLYDPEEIVWIDADDVEFSAENRSWMGVAEYDAFVPGSGVLVWHVDEGVIAEKIEAEAINNDPVHPGIALVEADGERDIGQPVFERLDEIEGSMNDPFFVGGKTRLAADTRPDAHVYRGWDSGVEIEVLSEPGDRMEVAIRFRRSMKGWPQWLPEGTLLQAEDLDGDGGMELIAGNDEAVRIADASGFVEWQIGDAIFLAAEKEEGIFVWNWQKSMVEAWRMGQTMARWEEDPGFIPRDALVSDRLEGFVGEQVLALVGEELVLLDAAEGTELRRLTVSGYRVGTADMDGDGEAELIVGSTDEVSRVTDGQVQPLWNADGDPLLPAAAGDVDGDGRMEIAGADVGGLVWLRDIDGTIFEIETGDSLATGPVIGDLDGIGDSQGKGLLEIVVAGEERIHALEVNGLEKENFPARIPAFAGVGAIEHAPLLLDLDWDGRQEIFLGTRQGVFGIDDDGKLLPGFPLLTAGEVRYTPVGADLDGDGRLELAAIGGSWLYLWEPQQFTPEYAGQRIGWGQEGYSATGSRMQPNAGEGIEPYLEEDILPAGRAYCYPNPVSGDEQAHLRFFLGRPASVSLEVFDAIGERVARLDVETEMAVPAENEITWSIADYASGLYICRLEARGEDGRKDAVLVKMAVSR